MSRTETVSALMPVHAGVAADHLRAAVASVLKQTRVPDEVVVVEDGPLAEAQLAVLDDLQQRHPTVHRVRLERNSGAGVANQAGLLAATGDWIAKWDADDLCLPARIARQLAALADARADVCGTAMLEFIDDPAHPVALRSMPADHDEIARRMRFNNPINHPSSMYRRSLAVDVGGYPDLAFMQDYDLFARMLCAGARMVNLAEPLVLFRAGESMRRRRSDRRFTRLEWELQRRLHDYGLVGRVRMVVNFVVRLAFRRLPAPLMRLVQGRVLSRPYASMPSGRPEGGAG